MADIESDIKPIDQCDLNFGSGIYTPKLSEMKFLLLTCNVFSSGHLIIRKMDIHMQGEVLKQKGLRYEERLKKANKYIQLKILMKEGIIQKCEGRKHDEVVFGITHWL